MQLLPQPGPFGHTTWIPLVGQARDLLYRPRVAPHACPRSGHCPTCGRIRNPVPDPPYTARPQWFPTTPAAPGYVWV